MGTTRRTLGALVALSMLGALTLSVVPASAAITHKYSGSSFGPTGPGSVFSEPQNVAVDQATGDVYVVDVGTDSVYKFDSAGDPVSFSASGLPYVSGNQLTGTPTEPFSFPSASVLQGSAATQVAVDSSGGPTNGDIYVTSFTNSSPHGGGIEIFGSDGTWLGSIGEHFSCGVTVAPNGDVYAATLTGFGLIGAGKFVPHANPVTGDDLVAVDGSGAIYGPCNLAVDSSGDVYIHSFRLEDITRVSDAQFAESNGGAVVAYSDGGFGVDPVSNDVYIDEGSMVSELDTAGVQVGSFSTFGDGSLGLAATGSAAATGKDQLYLSDPVNKEVDIYEPEVVPDVSVTPFSGLQGTSVTLNGAVGTAGGPDASAIQFEYGTSTAYGASAAASPASCTTSSATCAVTGALTGLVPNTLYHYRLDASNANGQSRGPDGTFTTPAVQPTTSNETTTTIGASHTGMLLSAAINPENAPTFYHFIYGPTSSYGSTGPELEAGPGFGDESLSEPIEGLQPGTTYHYAVVATNKAGTITGPDETFTTTAPVPPALTTGGVSEVTQSTAKLSGTVDTEGEHSSGYGFDLGIDANYSQAYLVGSAEAGLTGPQTITQTVEGLQPGTTYHYRLFATNTDGTTHSADATFTTAGPPNPSTVLDVLTVPAATPLIATPTLSFPAEANGPTTTTRGLTSTQKLAAALKACKRQPKQQRAKCQARARKRYAPTKKRKKR